MKPVLSERTKTPWIEKFVKNFKIRQAAKSSDLAEWELWLANAFSRQLERQDYINLRMILGRVMKSVNDISALLELSREVLTPEIQTQANNVLEEVNNWELIGNMIDKTLEIFSAQKYNSRDRDEISQILNLEEIIRHALWFLNNINLSETQQEYLLNLAAGNILAPNQRKKIDYERMKSMISENIYNIRDPRARTVRVVREILQNAADAAIEHARQNQQIKPQVDIRTQTYDDNTMDIMIRDNGLGMDWETLSQKFYVYFSSGKDEQEEATGGFGLAKAIIQESPEEGWVIDTQGIHSSRFHKNMYYATPAEEQFTPNKARYGNQGTTLTLYRLPRCEIYQIEDICSKYAIGDVVITINGEAVQPVFKLHELNVIDPDLNVLAENFGETEADKDVVRGTIALQKKQMPELLGNAHHEYWDEGRELFVKAEFFLKYQRKDASSGKLFVFVNNQYQFEISRYIEQAHIIVNVMTNIRPGKQNYPIDPGRENLRGDIKEDIDKIIDALKEIFGEISKNKLFSEGLDIFTYNKEKEPIDVRKIKKNRIRTEDKNSFLRAISPPQQIMNEEPSQNQAAQIIENLKAIAAQALTQDQQQIVSAVMSSIEGKNNIDFRNELDKILEYVTTPCDVIVQKNFVSRELVNNRVEITKNLMIIWHECLKICIETIKDVLDVNSGLKPYVPGVLFTNEALALVLNEKTRKFVTVAINPLSVAALVDPPLFEKIFYEEDQVSIEGGDERIYRDIRADDPKNQTAIERVSQFMKHEAVHELAHYLYPSYWGGYSLDDFHSRISKLEYLTDRVYPEIWDVCKKYMKGLREDSQKLIRAVRKDIRKREKRKQIEEMTESQIQVQPMAEFQPTDIAFGIRPRIANKFDKWIKVDDV